MAVEIDVNRLPDGIYPVSFDRGDVLSGASGIYMNSVHIFTQDWYDLVDVSTLKVGDTIVVEGETIRCQDHRPGRRRAINGGLEARTAAWSFG